MDSLPRHFNFSMIRLYYQKKLPATARPCRGISDCCAAFGGASVVINVQL
jgi:hypothetical protein